MIFVSGLKGLLSPYKKMKICPWREGGIWRALHVTLTLLQILINPPPLPPEKKNQKSITSTQLLPVVPCFIKGIVTNVF